MNNYIELKNCANTLGVTIETYNEQGIKRAFRKLAKTKHPDVGGSDKEFLEISDAYDKLLNAFIMDVPAYAIFQIGGKSTSMFKGGRRGLKNKTTTAWYLNDEPVNWDLVNEPICISFGQFVALNHGATIYTYVNERLEGFPANVFITGKEVQIFYDVELICTNNSGNVYNSGKCRIDFLSCYNNKEPVFIDVSIPYGTQEMTLKHFGVIDKYTVKKDNMEIKVHVPIIDEVNSLNLKNDVGVNFCYRVTRVKGWDFEKA